MSVLNDLLWPSVAMAGAMVGIIGGMILMVLRNIAADLRAIRAEQQRPTPIPPLPKEVVPEIRREDRDMFDPTYVPLGERGDDDDDDEGDGVGGMGQGETYEPWTRRDDGR